MRKVILFVAALLGAVLWDNEVVAADTTPPTIQSVTPAPNSSVNVLTNITVIFSEPIQGIAWDDLFINGNPGYSLSGQGTTWTFYFEQPPPGPVVITWDAGHNIHDLSGNRFNETNAVWAYTLIDNVPPTVASIVPQPGLEMRGLSQIEVTFSESVLGIDASDLIINGQPATNITVLAGYRYVFKFPPQPAGVVTVSWAQQHNITDTSGNPFSGQSFSYTVNPLLGLPTLRINEILASAINTNNAYNKDEDGQLQDWIEIYNYGTNTVNLTGFGITDDKEDPFKWTFPSTNIAAGQYMVIFASEKNRRTPGKPLHLNFRLNVYGDYLGLFSPDVPDTAVSEFSPKFPELRNDYSVGYDNNGEVKYFSKPTPGGSNGTSQISGIAPPPNLNVRRGFYNAPFTLILSSSLPDAKIRYTTDGSEPTATSGFEYISPITIKNTTIFRAATFMTNMLPSTTETHTYIFLDQVLKQPNNPPGFPTGTTIWGGYPSDYEIDPEIVNSQQYSNLMKSALLSIPTVSIVMNIEDIFGTANGIYTHSSDSQTLYRGPDWERPCSAELILTNGQTGFQINCGIQIQGNASRNPQKTPKHPLRLLFKGVYGPTALEYPVFSDSPVKNFDSLVMRADFNNSWTHWDPNQRLRGTRIRDAWGKETARAMGMAAPHTLHFHLYINGLYWGVYEFSEKIDASFAANYFGGNKSDYDAIASKPTQAIDGDLTAFNTMANYIKGNNMADPNNFLQACKLLDMTNFIDYMLLNFFTANQDWGNDSNWNAIHKRSPNEPVRFLAWDLERFIEYPTDNRVSNTDCPVGLHPVLINSAEYKLLFADRIHKHLFNNGALTAENNAERWKKWTNVLQLAIIGESARWGDYRRDVHQYQNPPYYLYTLYDHWLPEVTRVMTNYFPNRNSNFLNQAIAAGLYPNPSIVAAPFFNQHGGSVSKGFVLKCTNSPAGVVYYTTNGVDPRVYGTGAVSPQAAVLTANGVVLNNSVVVKARTYNAGVWSALAEASFLVERLDVPLRITEIMYNPIGGDTYEFIELKNIGELPINIGLFSIDGEIRYNFPPNIFIDPGQVIVLASDNNPIAFTNRYPNVNVFGWFSGKLNNGGGRIYIKDGTGQIITVAEYDDEGGWPTAADGAGYSLELINESGDMRDLSNWRASSVINGTPGVTSTQTNTVYINEVMAWNVSSVLIGTNYPDWVELYNSASNTIDISGWSITDGSNPRKFVIPQGTAIPAGGYLVIVCDIGGGDGRLHSGFALNRTGDMVLLYDAQTNYVDGITFGNQLEDFTLGRIQNQWTLCSPTLGTSNVAAPLGSQTNLVINEWMSNPLSGGRDWVEIYNRSPLPVSLYGLYFKLTNGIYQYLKYSFIPATGYLQLFAEEGWKTDELGFTLPKQGGSIILYDSKGGEVDRIAYTETPTGASQGRYPDGGNVITNFIFGGTPGAVNEMVVYSGPVFNELMAQNDGSIRNGFGRASDWIELKNNSSTAYDLSGMGLSDSQDGKIKWHFPAGVVIQPGSYIVIWCDGQIPASTDYSQELNCGFGLKAEGGGVYLYDVLGRLVDRIEYGAQLKGVSIGRINDSQEWELLSSPTPGSKNSGAASFGNQMALKINEWLANSPQGNDWIELYNPQPLPVKLSGMIIKDLPDMLTAGDTIKPLTYIGSNSYVRFIADNNGGVIGHLNFALSQMGESIQLLTSNRVVVDTVYFGMQKANVSMGRLLDGGTNIVEFTEPSAGDPNHRGANGVIISKVIHNQNQSGIEIKNLGTSSVNIGGWYLSDRAEQLKKYRIAQNTVLSAGQSLFISAEQINGGSGSIVPFTLNFIDGGELWLMAVDNNGELDGRGTRLLYNGIEDGMAYGFIQTSVGRRGAVCNLDGTQKVGPLVISEIMYQPPDSADYEFIEIQNISTNTVYLYDANRWWARWSVSGGVEYKFPYGAFIRAGGFLILVNFDPADYARLLAFKLRYGISADVPIYGPYNGNLANEGDSVVLERIGSNGESIEVDRVDYGNGSDGIWQPANGTGFSLQRIRPWDFGNEPSNWRANIPTAGRANRIDSGFIDNDNDGMDSVWEANNGLSDSNPQDALLDNDGDGLTNLQEYWLGTNPNDPNSKYKPPQITGGIGDKSAVLWQPVSWQITAQGEGELSYRWIKDNQPVSGANSSTFAISNLTEQDAGVYQVAVINNGGVTISPPMKLIALIPPKILVQPQSLSVTNGSNATFTVIATGTGLIQYQWKKDGVLIPGETNQTLELTNVTLADMGSYSVVVQDDISSVESAPAQLVVLLNPIILQQPQSQIVFAGSTVVFDVVATGTPPLGYRWRRVSTGLVTNIGISQLTLTNVGAPHAQFYNVIITNSVRPAGIISTNAYLVVITDWPKQDQTVAPGSTATFSVTVAKYTTLAVSYQWLKDGNPVQNATNAAFSITNVSINDLGYYSVKIAAAGVELTTPPVKLQLPTPQLSQPLLINGALQVSITAPTNINNYWIQSSTNLISWQDLMPLTLTNQTILINLPITNSTQRLFIRLKGNY